MTWRALLVVVAMGCGGTQGGVAPTPPKPAPTSWDPALLAFVPAETPYAFAALDNHGADGSLGSTVKRRLARSIAKLERAPGADPTEPGLRVLRTLLAEMRSPDPRRWPDDLGFASDARYVFYGLSFWPVVRAEVANPARVREVIDHVIAAIGTPIPTATLDGQPYWIYAHDALTVVVAVREHDFVAAMLPSAAASAMLPSVLGTSKPAHSLRDAPLLTDEIARYHFLGSGVGYLDVRGLAQQLAAAAGVDEPSGCRTELARIIDLAPRFVLGFTRRDRESFAGTLALELAPDAAAALQRLHTELPLEPPADAIFTMAAAVDLDGALALAQQIAAGVHDHPFTCPWLRDLNTAADEAVHELGPLPAMAQGIRGAGVSVREGQAIDGQLVVVGKSVVATAKQFLGAMPGMVRGPVEADGTPVEVNAEALGLKDIESAFVALKGDRVVGASGPDAMRRAAHLASLPPAGDVPLLLISLDPERAKRRFPSLFEGDNNEDLHDFRSVEVRIDADAGALRMDVSGVWK